jgi:ABC-type Fe3+/spermidine/putrescine transport system ATPase subunit
MEDEEDVPMEEQPTKQEVVRKPVNDPVAPQMQDRNVVEQEVVAENGRAEDEMEDEENFQDAEEGAVQQGTSLADLSVIPRNADEEAGAEADEEATLNNMNVEREVDAFVDNVGGGELAYGDAEKLLENIHDEVEQFNAENLADITRSIRKCLGLMYR